MSSKERIARSYEGALETAVRALRSERGSIGNSDEPKQHNELGESAIRSVLQQQSKRAVAEGRFTRSDED